MIKICYLILTMTTGQPTLINFNEVLAITEEESFGLSNTRIYFNENSNIVNFSISVKDTIEEIAAKTDQCLSRERFIFIGK